MAAHNEGGYRERHMSVAHYQTGEGGRRRSSVVAAPIAAAETGQLNTRDETLRKMSVAVPNLAEVISDAKNATELERHMTFREGVKLYPKAILFSFVLSLAVVMEGYDTALIGNFYGMQQFNQRYGEPVGDGTYQIPAKWQNALSNGGQVGSILGLMLNGIVSEKIGYRKTMIGSLFLIICFIFINFFATNIQTLLAGYILCGVPWGVFQTLTTTYAAEVTPVALRAYLTTYVNLCWVMGQFVSAGVLRGMEARTDQWAYRIPYAIQWIWPVPIMIGAFFAPESPWWLVRHGRLDDARRALTKLTSPKNTQFNLEDTLAMMIHTNEMELQQTAGASYLACFKGADLRRTEISCLVWMIQTLCGSPLMGSGVYFMQQAGLSQTDSYSLNIGQTELVPHALLW
jgi:MFS transporter, SP family, general alpha glucoside:H+ symporter